MTEHFCKLSDLPKVEQIDYLLRELAIHSFIYYDHNYNVITDKLYDEKSQEVYKLIKENQSELHKCAYAHLAQNFDPCSGFYFANYLTETELSYIKGIAISVLNNYKKNLNKSILKKVKKK